MLVGSGSDMMKRNRENLSMKSKGGMYDKAKGLKVKSKLEFNPDGGLELTEAERKKYEERAARDLRYRKFLESKLPFMIFGIITCFTAYLFFLFISDKSCCHEQ